MPLRRRAATALAAVALTAACSAGSELAELRADPMATVVVDGTSGPAAGPAGAAQGAPDPSTTLLRRLRLDGDPATVVAAAVAAAVRAGWAADAGRTSELSAVLTKPGRELAVYVEDDSPAATPGTGPYDLDLELSTT